MDIRLVLNRQTWTNYSLFADKVMIKKTRGNLFLDVLFGRFERFLQAVSSCLWAKYS